MAAITITDYLSIMTDYNTSFAALSGITDGYYDAAYTVLLANVFDPEIDLLVSFYTAYNVSVSSYSSAPTSVINAVRALQDHILSKDVSAGTGDQTVGAKYADIDEFYEDNAANFPTAGSAIIPTGFATMSQQAGHTIDSTYIIGNP